MQTAISGITLLLSDVEAVSTISTLGRRLTLNPTHVEPTSAAPATDVSPGKGLIIYFTQQREEATEEALKFEELFNKNLKASEVSYKIMIMICKGQILSTRMTTITTVTVVIVVILY